MRERILRFLTYNFLGAAVVGVSFGVMAPFGTAEVAVSMTDRYLYWLIAIMLNWMQAMGSLALMMESPLATRIGLVRLSLMIAVALSFPASFEILWLNHTLLGSPIGSPAHLAEVWLDTLVVYALLTPSASAFFLPRSQKAVPRVVVPADTVRSETPLFFERIPRSLGNRLLALGMEDHYLRIYTDLGSDLVLCRFADALRELNTFDGLQVHRSWYVARSAIAEVQRDGRSMLVRLVNGLEVPVSRAYQKDVAQAPLTAPH